MMENILGFMLQQKGILLFTVLYISSLMSSQTADGARILALFSAPAPSHNIMFQAFMKALAEKGHSVEVASPIPLFTAKPPNYTEVILPVPKMDKNILMKELISIDNTPLKEHLTLWGLANPLCEFQLSSPELQNYLSYNPKGEFADGLSFQDPTFPKVDLLVIEMFFVDCMLGFAHHLDVPMVAIVSQYFIPWGFDAMGNPKSYTHVPYWFLPYGPKMSFFERLHNYIFTVGVGLYRRYYVLPQQDEIARRHFGSAMPHLWEIEKKTNLVLFNGHPAVTPIHPSLPNILDVAGMHILANPPPLPVDLQQLMDKNEKVILFSLGSNINGNTIEEVRLTTILNVFKELQCEVLWSYGDIDELHIPLPANVHAYKWLPQQSILAHPNLVAFVTHGGLLSIQETIYHGVPIVGFPFYGDQFMNLRHATDAGFGITLNFYTFTEKDLINTMEKILLDPGYSIAAKKLSSVFRDQPETPLERGVYWTEYIMRHKGAPHLQSAAKDLNWFQYYLIDVFVFIFTILVVIIFVIYYICRMLKYFIFSFSKKSKRD